MVGLFCCFPRFQRARAAGRGSGYELRVSSSTFRVPCDWMLGPPKRPHPFHSVKFPLLKERERNGMGAARCAPTDGAGPQRDRLAATSTPRPSPPAWLTFTDGRDEPNMVQKRSKSDPISPVTPPGGYRCHGHRREGWPQCDTEVTPKRPQNGTELAPPGWEDLTPISTALPRRLRGPGQAQDNSGIEGQGRRDCHAALAMTDVRTGHRGIKTS